MLNVISVDVEEYFQVENLAQVCPRKTWDAQPSRIEYGIKRVLDLFDRLSVKATFFVLGLVAQKHPELIREIVRRGHEIASHGFAHKLVYTQKPGDFLADTGRAKSLLEDISGEPVFGYRAPSFSITPACPWAYQILVENGYRYDSSLYPIWHPRYANLHRSTEPEMIKTDAGNLFEFPLAVHSLRFLGLELRLPLAGGAYWRLLPSCYINWGLRSIAASSPGWFVCYFHPWELDDEQPVFAELSFKTKLRHYGRISSFEQRLERYLKSYSFAPLRDAGKQTFGDNFLLGA